MSAIVTTIWPPVALAMRFMSSSLTRRMAMAPASTKYFRHRSSMPCNNNDNSHHNNSNHNHHNKNNNNNEMPRKVNQSNEWIKSNVREGSEMIA